MAQLEVSTNEPQYHIKDDQNDLDEMSTAPPSRSTSNDSGIDLEMVKCCRGVRLPDDQGPELCMVREWFEENKVDQVEHGEAPYCIPIGHEDWYTTGCNWYDADKEESRERLYRSIVTMFDMEVPLVLLARQAPRYSLFFDLDVYGSSDGDNLGDLHSLVWERERYILIRSIAAAILSVYPQFHAELEIAVFTCSGYDLAKERSKASYHVIFPQIIVDRPVKAWPSCPTGSTAMVQGRHIVVRDHIVYYLLEQMEQDSRIRALHHDLLDCSDHAVVESDLPEVASGEEDAPFLNDWSEIFDERPLWHEPWLEAATGFRLPLTDKAAAEGSVETRPKKPLEYWKCSLTDELERPEADLVFIEPHPKMQMELVDWVRLGDISVCSNQDVTPWSEERILREPSLLD